MVNINDPFVVICVVSVSLKYRMALNVLFCPMTTGAGLIDKDWSTYDGESMQYSHVTESVMNASGQKSAILHATCKYLNFLQFDSNSALFALLSSKM